METLEQFVGVFAEGQKYTIYKISEMSAMTVKMEITVKRLVKRNGFSEHPDCAVFTPRRKRKEYILPFESRSYQSAPLLPCRAAIFEGWDQPVVQARGNEYLRRILLFVRPALFVADNLHGALECFEAFVQALLIPLVPVVLVGFQELLVRSRIAWIIQ